MTRTARNRSLSRLIASWLSFVLIVAAALLLYTNAQRLQDWWALRDYQPPLEVAQFASDTTMTSYATRVYYVNRPLLYGKQEATKYCPEATEQSFVLGCYVSDQQGIFLLTVDNDELAGIEQVTAAHEMLHAAYDRLSDGDRARINRALQAYYDTLPAGTLKETVDAYLKTEPQNVVNEMHSIFATQARTLPADLETYYAQYFTKRSAIVDYYDSYEAAFQKRRDQVAQYDQQLNIWKPQIDELQATINAQSSELLTRQTAMNRDRASGNIQGYNSQVDGYNAFVARYNATIRRAEQLIADYNALIETRNAVALEERALSESLKATPVTE